MKSQAKTEFQSVLSKISTSYPDPAWSVDQALVVTRSNVEGFPMQLGRGGHGAVYLEYYLDVGVAKKVFHEDEGFDSREVDLCFELHHPTSFACWVRLLPVPSFLHVCTLSSSTVLH